MAIESQNIYKNARKSAGFTQEKASQLLNVSVDSLRYYEQSQRPVPSDVASAMCDVYQAPYLAVQHLRLTSDLGKRVVPEIQLKDLPEAVLGVLAAVQRFCAKREAMVEIAADGQIAESEQAEWDEIMCLANDLNVAMRDITVGEYQFKVRPFGAKDATYIFGDVASIILPILGTVSVASDDKDAVNMEMFDGMDMDKDSLVKALARINGNALSKLVSELLLDHSNIRVLDPEKNTYEVMGEDDFDEIFCQYLAGMLNLCAEVIRLNFSGFFKDASTLFGGLIKVRRAGSSNSTESSTTTE